jgi:hypothetical protein
MPASTARSPSSPCATSRSGEQITIDYAMVLYHSTRAGLPARLPVRRADVPGRGHGRRLADRGAARESIAAGFSRSCRRRSTNQGLIESMTQSCPAPSRQRRLSIERPQDDMPPPPPRRPTRQSALRSSHRSSCPGKSAYSQRDASPRMRSSCPPRSSPMSACWSGPCSRRLMRSRNANSWAIARARPKVCLLSLISDDLSAVDLCLRLPGHRPSAD